MTIGPQHEPANTKRGAARQAPEGLHERAHKWLETLTPIHAASPASQCGSGALCTGTTVAVLGKFFMYALIAIGLVAGLFGLLNLIEFRRLD